MRLGRTLSETLLSMLLILACLGESVLVVSPISTLAGPAEPADLQIETPSDRLPDP